MGVSNFGVAQLKALAASGLEAPAVNQIECHAWLQQAECRACVTEIVPPSSKMIVNFWTLMFDCVCFLFCLLRLLCSSLTTRYCAAHGIHVTGYCPLARCKPFGTTPLQDVAARLGRTEAEVAIRWSLQVGITTIPKSVNAGRIASNADCVDGGWGLSEADMKSLSDEKVNVGFKASNAVNAMDLPWAQVSGEKAPPARLASAI